MIHTLDVAAALLVAAALMVLAVAYAVRVTIAGRARSERTDRAGGSALLGKPALEFGYWTMAPVGRALARRGVTPNMVSWTSLVLGAATGAALAAGLFGVACLAAAVSGLLDTLDGMVARLTGRSSEAGEVLDATVDRYAEALFCAGAALHFHDRPALALVALVALIGCFMVSYSTAKAEAMDVDPPTGMMRRQERAAYLTMGAGLTALLSPWVDDRLGVPGTGLPIVVTLAFVGILSNVAAVRRMRAVAATLRSREGVDRHASHEQPSDVVTRA